MGSFILLLVFVLSLANLQCESATVKQVNCSMQKHGGDMKYCVFRNLSKIDDNIEFGYSGATKPSNFAFVNCHMEEIPRIFTTTFGNNLEALKIENSTLQSVTISKNLKTLHAANNNIKTVLIDNCNKLKEVDLSRNQLKVIRNITSCKRLEMLNLSGNRQWSGDTIDLSEYENLTQLQHLSLSDIGVVQIKNKKKIKLPHLNSIDLSGNAITAQGIQLDVFYTFPALKILKLDDNRMESIAYTDLMKIKSLKAVYLNGNSFQCGKIKAMMNFLQRNNITAPLDHRNNCQRNAQKAEGMCCTDGKGRRNAGTTTRQELWCFLLLALQLYISTVRQN